MCLNIPKILTNLWYKTHNFYFIINQSNETDQQQARILRVQRSCCFHMALSISRNIPTSINRKETSNFVVILYTSLSERN